MPPKKKDEPTAEASADFVTKEAPTPAAPPKEKLLTLRAVVFFSDGNLREFMESYGYECEWKMNEVRSIPKWLAQRCIQSGAELERADGG